MLYYALGFFLLAVLMLSLGFAGVAPGAAGIVSLALLVSLVLLAFSALTLPHGHHLHRRRLHHR
jgi:uncharacterized membrane protein YtjA (UPF0391 family)